MQTRHWHIWLFISPAIVLILIFLIYPAVMTLFRSFFGTGIQVWGNTLTFVGLKNWKFIFTNQAMLTALRNNALWAIIFTGGTVTFGLALAVMLDRVRYEKLVKTIIFVPAAISMVGAAVIWKFIYAYRPIAFSQIGILNALVVAMGGEPIGWLIHRPWVNNIALITVGIWIWTGFCMVIFSAAYKNIDPDLLDAARIDGANEWQLLWRVILPLLAPTAAVIATIMVVQVLKIFDIVFVMTNGAYGTEVIANRMYKEMFIFYNYGRASAIAAVLLLLISPFMILNIRRFMRQEGKR